MTTQGRIVSIHEDTPTSLADVLVPPTLPTTLTEPLRSDCVVFAVVRRRRVGTLWTIVVAILTREFDDILELGIKLLHRPFFKLLLRAVVEAEVPEVDILLTLGLVGSDDLEDWFPLLVSAKTFLTLGVCVLDVSLSALVNTPATRLLVGFIKRTLLRAPVRLAPPDLIDFVVLLHPLSELVSTRHRLEATIHLGLSVFLCGEGRSRHYTYIGGSCFIMHARNLAGIGAKHTARKKNGFIIYDTIY